jgi:hypothetical protein
MFGVAAERKQKEMKTQVMDPQQRRYATLDESVLIPNQ